MSEHSSSSLYLFLEALVAGRMVIEREASRNVRALTLFSLFRGFSVSGYQALFAAYMRTIGYSMSSIGGVITVASIIGAIIDCVGARTAL
jgi:alpha-D-ribose 1-methylphosphonate 5-phosphate C-P lyase